MYKPDISTHKAIICTYNGAISSYNKIISPYHGNDPLMTKWLAHLMEPAPHARQAFDPDTEPVAHTRKSARKMIIRPAQVGKPGTHARDSITHIKKCANAVTNLDTGVSILDSQSASLPPGMANGGGSSTPLTG